MVDNLAEALSAPETLAEAGEIVRQLIDRVVLEPREDGGMNAMLYGDLAVLLSADEGRTASDPGRRGSGSLLSVVAGTRNHLYRTTLAWCISPDRKLLAHQPAR
jgi:hypothetical protein